MAMIVRFISIMYLISFDLFGQQTNTTYKLKGIDENVQYSVNVTQDLIHETLTATLFNGEEVRITGVQDIVSSIIHEGSFLELQLRERGGSGVKVRRKVVLCASDRKIYISLDILSEVVSQVFEVYEKKADSLHLFDERVDYHVSVAFKHDNGIYFATLIEKKVTDSKYDPSQNEITEEHHKLTFDKITYCFYETTKKLHGYYTIHEKEEKMAIQKHLELEAPGILLRSGKMYVLLRDKWYFYDGINSLFEQ